MHDSNNAHPHSPSGLARTNVIDLIAQNAKTGDVELVMTQTDEWNGSDEQIFLLQEKINAYLSFALDGEMVEAYPQFIGKPLRLRLDCSTIPDARTQQFIDIVRTQIGY